MSELATVELDRTRNLFGVIAQVRVD